MAGGPVRVAVVGAGYMGGIHARTIARIARERPGLAELAYVADVDYLRARRLAEAYGAKPLEGLTGELARADLAIVSTPTATHRAVVERLYSIGVRAFLVEKPVALTLDDAAAVARLSRRGAWVSVGHSERFNPALLGAAEAWRRGLLEGLDALETRRLGPFVERARGVDVVRDLAIHDLDVILSLVGEEPREVYARVESGIVTSLPDYSVIILSFNSTTSSTVAARISPVKERIARLYTGAGSIVELDFLRFKARAVTASSSLNIPVPGGEPIYREDLEVLESIASGKEPPVGVGEASVTLYLCLKALESAGRGGAVRPREDPDYQRHRSLLEEGLQAYSHIKRRLSSRAAAGVGSGWRRKAT